MEVVTKFRPLYNTVNFVLPILMGKLSGHCLVLDTLLGIEGATLSYSVRVNWWLKFNDTACLCTLLELNLLFLLFDFHKCLTINFLQMLLQNFPEAWLPQISAFISLGRCSIMKYCHSVSSDQSLCSIHWWIVNYKQIQLVKVASISLVPMSFIWFNQYAVNFWLLMRNIFVFSYLKWNQNFLVIVLIN